VWCVHQRVRKFHRELLGAFLGWMRMSEFYTAHRRILDMALDPSIQPLGGLLLTFGLVVFRVAHESSKAIKTYLGGGEKKKDTSAIHDLYEEVPWAAV